MTVEIPEPRDLSTIEASSLVQICDQHSYKTEMFCKDCRVLGCAICFLFGDHKGHSGADIEETREIVLRLESEQQKQVDTGKIRTQVAAKVGLLSEKFKGLA